MLQGQYVVGRVLGKPGGSGITYLSYYLQLETTVAIKEYLPRDLASRDQGQTHVRPHSDDDYEAFQSGLKQFLKEGRTLARLQHDNVVRVRAFFEEHGTAYLVMDYYEGMSLLEYVAARGGRIPEQLAVSLMTPVLDGLAEVHKQGFLHRDIKPANIYLTSTGKSILLDFGAAKQAASDRTGTLSFLTPGFAPWEQYKQGGARSAATDVYACGATFYYLICGAMPDDAPHRMVADRLQPLKERVPGVSALVSDAVEWAMSLQEADRPQSIRAFQDALLGVRTAAAPEPGEQSSETIDVRPHSVAFTALMDTRRVTAHVLAAAGVAIEGAPVTWHSSDPNVVSVDARGAVTSLQPGKAMIEARHGDVVGRAHAEVAQVPARILLSPGTLTLRAGTMTDTISARVLDRNDQPVAGAKVEWETDDPAVATVDAAGKITARTVGTTETRARVGDISATMHLVVAARISHRKAASIAAVFVLCAVVGVTVLTWDQREPVAAVAQEPLPAVVDSLSPNARPDSSAPPMDRAAATDAYVHIVGRLPDGARVSVDGEDARQARSGDSIAVQPGSHVLRITAEGYDPAEHGVRLAAGEGARWQPILRQQLVEIPSAAPGRAAEPNPAAPVMPEPQPPAPQRDSVEGPAADTAAPPKLLQGVGPHDQEVVRSVVAAFFQAATTRDADRLRSIWPGMTAEAVADWLNFWNGRTDIQVATIDHGTIRWAPAQHRAIVALTSVTFWYRESDAPGLKRIASAFPQIILQRDEYGKWLILSMN